MDYKRSKSTLERILRNGQKRERVGKKTANIFLASFVWAKCSEPKEQITKIFCLIGATRA